MSNPTSPSRRWDTLRCVVLATTLLGTGLVFAKAVSAPVPQATTTGPQTNPPQSGNARNFKFPTSVPIPGWQQIQEQAVTQKPDLGAPPTLSAHQYRYQRGNVTTQVQMWYLLAGEGNISRYLSLYTPMKSTIGLQETYQPSIGHAGLLKDGQKLHLSSCINMRGQTTLTQQQFTQSRYENDLTAPRVLGWVIGQNDLLDRRCLFTVITLESVTKTATPSSEAAEELIKGFWKDWHQWWQPHISQTL